MMTLERPKRVPLVVALDFPASKPALDLARLLQDVRPEQSAARAGEAELWMKIGSELFTAAGPELVQRVRDLGFPVFLDLKFQDIPHTVGRAVAAAVRLGAAMTNIHIAGGRRMAEAALEGLTQAGEPGTGRTVLLGVTVLTSAGDQETDAMGLADPEIYARAGLPAPRAADVALSRAQLAKTWGLHGVVCSGHEARSIKAACGEAFLCLTPGVRPARAAGGDDQRRVMTPAQAVAAGSDFIVAGRPITRAARPAAAARDMLAEIAAACAGL